MGENERVFVMLGAGFSRAVSEVMPTLDRLGRLVVERLGIEPDELGPFNGNLEEWLTYLATDQPWLSESQNLENRGRSIRVIEAIHEAISHADSEAARQPFAMWLQRLVWWMFDQTVSVATFNYDVLLERAASTLGLTGSWKDIYQIWVDDRRSMTIYPAPPAGSVARVFKLHGSISWAYAGPSAPISEKIILARDQLGWIGDMASKEAGAADRELLYRDLVPMIVPPTFSKTSYYGNTSMRSQWRDASEELKQADHLVVMGYSLPPGDLNARHFVATSFNGHRVTVIDHDEQVAARFAELLGLQDVEWFGGVEEFVESTCGDVVSWGSEFGDCGYPHPYLTENGVDVLPSEARSCDHWHPGGDATSETPLTWITRYVAEHIPGVDRNDRRDRPQRAGKNSADAYVGYRQREGGAMAAQAPFSEERRGRFAGEREASRSSETE